MTSSASQSRDAAASIRELSIAANATAPIAGTE